jgi:hypothetical protein
MVVKFAANFITFFYIVANRVANKLINSLTVIGFSSIASTLPPPKKSLPRRVCAGLDVSIKSAPLEGAEAHHDGDGCVFCCFDF